MATVGCGASFGGLIGLFVFHILLLLVGELHSGYGPVGNTANSCGITGHTVVFAGRWRLCI